ncbi:MAG: 16S rRNA (guanine(527)-N(7))-methyltransferase RsmG [Hyphomonadaceae bacterium]|nr:16S rRNA (guanine(527)-N(7))-methyltransferase RsmG [Clostridia bacterium]
MDIQQMLSTGALAMGVTLTDEQISKLMRYSDLLVDWNERMNLTTIIDPTDIAIKHFLDCLTCVQTGVFKPKLRMIDVGTGAGFPGIPLHIAVDGLQTVLLDALAKRVNFLNEVIAQLGLEHIQTVHARAEDAAHNRQYRERFDIAVSRAVANLAVLSEYALPFLKVGGIFIAQKGPKATEELAEAKKAIKILGGELVDSLTVDLPFTDIKHHLVVIKKVQHCSTNYPRKAGKPSKEPLK